MHSNSQHYFTLVVLWFLVKMVNFFSYFQVEIYILFVYIYIWVPVSVAGERTHKRNFDTVTTVLLPMLFDICQKSVYLMVLAMFG